METYVGEMGCTVGFLVKILVKMTINLSCSDIGTFGPQRNLLNIQIFPSSGFCPSGPLLVPHRPFSNPPLS